MHKQGIAHRDIKPENLIINNKLDIKIADLGLGNLYLPGEKLKTACGSACYAAPEMIFGELYDGLKVDLWSCGITLYAMLCG
jgi:serine/threonine protein kinase